MDKEQRPPTGQPGPAQVLVVPGKEHLKVAIWWPSSRTHSLVNLMTHQMGSYPKAIYKRRIAGLDPFVWDMVMAANGGAWEHVSVGYIPQATLWYVFKDCSARLAVLNLGQLTLRFLNLSAIDVWG